MRARGQRPRRWLPLVATTSCLLVLLGGASSQGGSPSSVDVDRAMAARASYGFPAGRSLVRRLGTANHGAASERYGFPLTSAEHAELLARSAYAREFEAKTLPFARKLEGFGGAWLDHEHGGHMVVSLTKLTPTARRQVRARLVDRRRGVRFVRVNDSAADLARALQRAERDWAALKTTVRPQSFGISYRYNHLVVKVLPGQLTTAERFAARMARRSGVDVAIEPATRVIDTGCPSRQKCFDPLQLGARMNYGRVYDPRAPRQQRSCGMGFMLSNRTILTAGHCTHGYAGPWHGHAAYRKRFGRIGRKASSRYTRQHRDLSLIRLDDWKPNKTTRIFGDAWPAKLTQPGQIIDNMDVCVSLARQDKVWCGRVTEPRARWWSSTARVWVQGAGMRFDVPGRTSLPGDSGSPIVSVHQECPACRPKRTPIGIVNAGNEVDERAHDPRTDRRIDSDLYFASVYWAVNNKNAWPELKVYTGPTSTPKPTPKPVPKPPPTSNHPPRPKGEPRPEPTLSPVSGPTVQATPSPGPAVTEAPA